MIVLIIVTAFIFSAVILIYYALHDDKINSFIKSGKGSTWQVRCGTYILEAILIIIVLPATIILMPVMLISEYYEKNIEPKTKWGKRKIARRKEKEAMELRLAEEEREQKKIAHDKWIKEHPNKFRDQQNGNLNGDSLSYLFLNSNIPIKQNEKQIIYFEDKYYEFYNNYFRENMEEIQTFFHRNGGYDFIYIPSLIQGIDIDAQNRYHHPSGKLSDVDKDTSSNFFMKYFVDLCVDDIVNEIKNGLHCLSRGKEISGKLGPALIFSNHYFGQYRIPKRYSDRKDIICYSYYLLLPPETQPLEQQIHNILCELYCIQFNSLSTPNNNCNADSNFDDRDAAIIDEIKERVEKLRLHGITEGVIASLFKKKEKVSRMVITKDFRIFLPDYQNMEIKMMALPKAVFLLFLRHPEGIIFKNLPDYREELSGIYNKLTNRTIGDDISKSINDVTDPTKNSINEKCARIRGAFIAHFDDGLADNYCITGERGEPKKIILPRNLVTFE